MGLTLAFIFYVVLLLAFPNALSLAQLYLKTTFFVRAAGLLLSVDTKVTKKSFVPYGASGMSKFSFAGGKRKFNAIHCAYQKEDIEAMHPWTLLGYKKRT